jgi:hypothetical protein
MGLYFLLFSAAAPADVIELTLEVESPQIDVDDQGFTKVGIDGYRNLADPGHPALPARSIPVLLPPGQAVVSVEAQPFELIELPGSHVVFPAQKKYPPSYAGPREFTQPDPDVYARALLPGSIAKAPALQHKRGFAVLPVLVRPVVYLPGPGTLSYAPVITIRVTTRPAEKMPQIRGIASDFRAVESMVINPGMLNNYPVKKNPVFQDGQYVIITNQALSQCAGADTLADLAAEKNGRGITTLIKTTEEIYTEYTGADDPEKVRNFIKDMYENHGTEYVLLAGDADLSVVGGETEPVIVPVRGLWGDIDYGGVEENLSSDIYYACLDGDFNADMDGVYGEPSDDPDLLAEVAVGRAPVDSCTEVQNFVAKTLAYRGSTDAYLKNVWMAGEYIGPDSYGKMYLEELHQGSAQGGILTRGFIENSFFEVQTLYDQDLCEQDCWGVSEMLAILNGDTHIVNHSGHSMTTYNMRLSCDDIDAGMTNSKYFFQITSGCYPGSFDNRLDPLFGDNQVSPQDSFTEHLMVSQYGAFGAVSCSRYGVGSLFERLFWDAAFSHGLKRLGEMHGYARDASSGWVENNYERWSMYGMNLFGDPELPMHMSNSTDPLMGVPSQPLWFVAVQGSGNPQDQTIIIRNDGGGTMNWTATSDQTWLTASPNSGIAPAEVTVSADVSGLPLGTSEATLTFTAPNAINSPQTVTVYAYLSNVPQVDAPHTWVSPQVDGVISEDEYAGAGYLDIGQVAPGRTAAKLIHDGEKLYILISTFDDDDADNDALMVVFDNNNDDQWPAQPGDEGLYQFLADGSAIFLPYYDDGKQGAHDMSPAGVEISFGLNAGVQRIVEVSFDLSQSHLKLGQGDSLGMYLIYFDQDGADYPVVGIWPPTGTALEACEFFGTVDMGIPSDAVTVDPSSLTFTGEAGGAVTVAQGLAIDATTASPLDLTFQTEDAWIQLSDATGTSPMTLEVVADPAALQTGTHEGTITIIAPQAQNSPLQIPVTFEVAEPAPVFAIDPPALTFAMTEGDPLPQSESLTITNTGGGTLEWTALPAGDWFELSEESGTAPSTVTVTPTADLPPGSHTSLILFTAEGAQPAQATVSITVTAEDKGGSSGCSTAPGGFGFLSILLLLFAGLRTYCKRQWTSS